jgi:hypothetical protein
VFCLLGPVPTCNQCLHINGKALIKKPSSPKVPLSYTRPNWWNRPRCPYLTMEPNRQNPPKCPYLTLESNQRNPPKCSYLTLDQIDGILQAALILHWTESTESSKLPLSYTERNQRNPPSCPYPNTRPNQWRWPLS